MRRKDREIKDFNKILEIINECQIIRLGLADGDFPYIVPVNFAYTTNNHEICFYIHGAMAGRKYELLKKNPRCSFEMDVPLGIDYIKESKDVTMRYKSIMGTAEVEFLEGEEKLKAITDVIMAKYDSYEYSLEPLKVTAVAKIKVLSITGKANPFNSNADI